MSNEIFLSEYLHLLKAAFQVRQDLLFTNTFSLSFVIKCELSGEILCLLLVLTRRLICALIAIFLFFLFVGRARLHSKQVCEEQALKVEICERLQDEISNHVERVCQSTYIAKEGQ